MIALGIAILAPLVLAVVFGPRQWALRAMVAGLLYLTMGQAVSVFGFELYATRILVLAAFMRVVLGGELDATKLNDIDKFVLIAYGYRAGAYILNGNGSTSLAIGYLLDTGLAYFAFRGLIRDNDDLVQLLKFAPVLLLPYAALSSIERWTGDNVFAPMGGITERFFERGGYPRVTGSFAHPSTFGSLGASLLPLYIALLFDVRRRSSALAGAIACLGMVGLANSGGPLSAAAVAVLGWFVWFVRRRMRIVRWAIVVVLCALAAVMKAPIWFLPAKVSAFSGGDGWHRSYLMQVAFEHLELWWGAGMNVLATRNWFPYYVPATGGADIINYYVDFGIAAGLPAMALFVLLLSRVFGRLGDALQVCRLRHSGESEHERILWGLGVMLSVHVVNWFGIVYFDQLHLVFCMQLAAISSLVAAENLPAAVRSRTGEPAAEAARYPGLIRAREGPEHSL